MQAFIRHLPNRLFVKSDWLTYELPTIDKNDRKFFFLEKRTFGLWVCLKWVIYNSGELNELQIIHTKYSYLGSLTGTVSNDIGLASPAETTPKMGLVTPNME